MLEIYYVVDGSETSKSYQKAADFVGAQLREVPDLEDYYHVNRALLDGQTINLSDATIGGLFRELNK